MKDTSFFLHFTAEEIEYLQKGSQSLCYKKNKILYLQEEPAESFYLICDGWVKLSQISSEGEEIVFDILTSGSPIGINAAFGDDYHASSAQLISDTSLLSISIPRFKNQISAKPELMRGMLNTLYKEQGYRSREIAMNTMRSAPQRIASFLLKLCPDNSKKNIVFDLPYDKALIAQTLGMTRGSFSRALNILRQQKLIRIEGVHVEIYSFDKLKVYMGDFFEK